VSKAQELAIANHSLAYGFGHGYLVAAGIALLALVIAVVMIRVKKSDLAGIDPMAAPTH
jgi:threonine/homoserine/homoserine lactone efflux protein